MPSPIPITQMGSSKADFFLSVYESPPKPELTTQSQLPTCTIELHMRFRYQLRIPSNEGALILIEDVLTPEWRTSFKVPIVFPLTMWKELYLKDLLDGLSLDPGLRNSIKPKIAEAALSLAERHGGKGFGMVVKVGILKNELMGKDEADRIAIELAKVGK